MRIFLFLFAFSVGVFANDTKDLRAQAAQLEKDGNWQESYELRVKILKGVDDEKSGLDLNLAIQSLQRLNQPQKVDGLLNELTKRKKNNALFMQAAGKAFLNSRSYGSLVDGEFRRNHRGGSSWIYVSEQDRIRALQCFTQAHAAVEKGGVAEAEILDNLADALIRNRFRNELWKLFLLTDLSEEPDYTEQIDYISGSGVPIEVGGKPTWINVPKSYEVAKSDGERWRWILKKIQSLDSRRGARKELAWWRFCVNHYGAMTLLFYENRSSLETRDGIMKLALLGEDETIARLATGTKRFKLREDYQFIPGLRNMMRAGKGISFADAGDELVQVFLNRDQRQNAVETLKELIRLHGSGSHNRRGKLLKQISGNWSKFISTPTYHAADPVEVPYVFRNAKEVSLTLMEVKDELVMQDIARYLEKNPQQIHYEKTNFSDVGNRLIQKDKRRYLGKKIRSWKEVLTPRGNYQDTQTELQLGRLNPGCYFLKSEIKGGNTSWIVVWVRDLIILNKSEKGNEVFYLIDSKAGQAVQGEIQFFAYRTEYIQNRKSKRRFNVLTKNFTRKTDKAGKIILQEGESKSNFQWYITARAGERRAYLTDTRLNWYSVGGSSDYISNKTIGITDRPVYRPGQKVYVKLWAGSAKYDANEVSNYAQKSAFVEIRDGRNEVVFKKSDLVTDEFGGVNFDFNLGEDAGLGIYAVMVKGAIPSSNFSFRVEEYKKPEFEVKVEAPSDPVSLGESFEATISANYYHGAPVTEAMVKVKVTRDFYHDRWFPDGEWDWLYGKGYWWFQPAYDWYPGWARWGCRRPSPPWWSDGRRSGAPESILEKSYPIGADGKVTVKIDSSAAKLAHGDQDHRYSITAEVVDASRRVIAGAGTVLAAREPYDVTVWLDRGYARIGDKVTGNFAARTLDGKKVEGKATAILYATSVNDAGEISEEEIDTWEVEGSQWAFTASKAGQYRVAVIFTDEKGKQREGAGVFSVLGPDGKIEGDFRYNTLELIPDKKEYRPGELVKLLVNVEQEDARVWLFIRPSMGKIGKTRIIQMASHSQVVEIPVTAGDMPNFFIEGVTVAKGEVHSVTREIVLPPEKRKLTVEVTPAKKKLKPREKTSLTVKVIDSTGEPYQGSAVITVYDKSLEYISDGSNIGGIVPFFWGWKRQYYGAGMASSQYLMGHHLQKPKTAAMQWLGIFHGVNLIASESDPFGDSRRRSQFSPKALRRDESEGAFDAFVDVGEAVNVTEQQAAPELLIRSEFADLLKWVGSVKTNSQGEATIELEMPDNLTTWKVKTWAMGHGTRVGEGSAEIVTSKDLIVRLQAPRFFIEKDEVTLSAIVHNYHEEAKDVTVSLELDGKHLEASGKLARRVVIPSQGETRIDWKAKALSEGEVTIRMKAIAADDSDAMEMKFPVFVHGILKTESFSRVIAPEGSSTKIEFTLPEERRPSESKLTLNYSPSVASAMIDALPYLASYPYGCTEQTLNRFVPTTVVHRILKESGYNLAEIKEKKINLNPQQLGDPKAHAAQWQRKNPHRNPVWDEAEVAKMERAGIAKLREQQNPDGGWGWFSAYGSRSYPHTTSVVMHGLLLARDHGVKVPDEMISRGLAWLEKFEKKEADKIAHWKKREENTKSKASSVDALVRRVLGEGGKHHKQMLGFLFRDKNDLPVYAKALLGLELHRTEDLEKRDEVIRNIRQFIKRDEENQTAYLELRNSGYWWSWYGSEFEAQAWFLKLLAAADPDDADTRGLVKYLINNRSHSTYWNSTRDTAYCIEAIGDYWKASKENEPDLSVEVIFGGKLLKTIEITKDNLFTFDNAVTIAGDILTGGKHIIELRKKGIGPLYVNAYVEYFTTEDFITKTGLEVKVDRTYYKLVPETKRIDAVDSEGQAIDQKQSKLKRVLLKSGDEVKSGDLIEVELGIDSKNDYEYLLFEDWKAAGMEPVEVRSGYNPNGLGAYMELRDEKVSMFVQNLPRGRHNLSYRLRAEIPGKFSALPTKAEAMYAPELRANSDEMKIQIGE